MARDGFFLGGMAEGMKIAEDLSRLRDEETRKGQTHIDDVMLRSRALDQAATAQSNTVDYHNKTLALQAQGLKNAEARALLTQTDKQIGDTFKVISETVTAGLDAGRDPELVAKAIAPLVSQVRSLSGKSGLDPGAIDVKVNALFARPSPTESATAKATAGISAAKGVSEATGVPMREALQGQGVLKAEAKSDSALEILREKIMTQGINALTPGEKQVYDDALKADPIARLIAAAAGGRVTAPNAAPAPHVPDPIGIR